MILLFILIAQTLSLELKGVHSTHYQENINWNLVKNSCYFAIIRSGFGTKYDRYWNANYNLAKEAGLKVGTMWFSYANSTADAITEAELCLKGLNGKQLEWPIYYEINEDYIFEKNVQNQIAEKFCSILEENGYYCGIFATDKHLVNDFKPSLLKKYSVWVMDIKPQYKGDILISKKEKVNGIGEIYTDIGYVDFEPIMKENGKNGFNKEEE